MGGGDKQQDKVHAELDKLVEDEYLGERAGEYWVTTDGHNMYAEALDNPYEYQPHYCQWVDEALTGISRDGKRSTVKNPVVPTSLRQGGANSVERKMVSGLHASRRIKHRYTRTSRTKKNAPRGG